MAEETIDAKRQVEMKNKALVQESCDAGRQEPERPTTCWRKT